MIICYENAQIFRAAGFVPGKLYVRDNTIVAPRQPDRTIDCQGKYLVPGFIDLQVNGVDNIDFTENPEQIPKASKLLAKEGIGGYLATIVSQPLERYIEIISQFKRDSICLGLHLEGPHINPKYSGAHAKANIVPECAVEFWEKIADPAVVKMVTLAPELARAGELIQLLHSRGIVVACGHTEASFQQLENSGLSCATHLFNAMKPFHHRESGPANFVLGRKRLCYSLIVDNFHLHPDTVAMSYNAYPEGLFLVSDRVANSLAGRPIHNQLLAGTSTLAGGCHSLLDCVKFFQKATGCTLHQAIFAASTKPAQIVKIDSQKGLLEEGFDADIVILDA